MSQQTTVQTVKTEFITNKDGHNFAYRRLGVPNGVPLLFLHHFRGTIDLWDPLLIHELAAERPVILFDNQGIGHSTGPVDNTVLKMANHAIEFLSLLNIKEVDILGFSLGGIVAPLVQLHGPPGLVRKLILAGTGPTAGPEYVPSPHSEFVQENAGQANVTEQNMLNLFFKPTETSLAAGHAWYRRIYERTKETSGEDRVGFVSEGFADGGAGITALFEALTNAQDYSNAKEGSYDRLGEINVPTLVANGYDDVMIPTVNSFLLSQKIPGAFLIVYPDAGHGFLFQYAEIFAKQVNDFLDGWKAS
ncbi:Alpha/Beta hydrolase protein [Bisporella sp. PMI_857]|nr:Alpha/Beta hydrolase protein [Bisporella sp. PMI_857]